MLYAGVARSSSHLWNEEFAIDTSIDWVLIQTQVVMTNSPRDPQRYLKPKGFPRRRSPKTVHFRLMA